MTLSNHPAYKDEKSRLEYIMEYIKKSLKTLANQKLESDIKLQKMKKTYNSDNSQNYIDLMVGTILDHAMKLMLKNLEAASTKPYFARLDFREDGNEKTDKLYIGKMSLMREADNELLIVDWRSPISNLYYEGRLGKASYICPAGEIEGNLLLKRQFTINNGNLDDIVDIDIATNDELLQNCLGANADNRLKDIVSTIQADQNRIIRADMSKPLIIQGVAGSGKTTIALHRIAYLVYTHEKSFKPDEFMIIAPNRLFLNYISNVLPDLGVDDVKQTTLEDYSAEVIGEKLKVKEVNEKLSEIIDGKELSGKRLIGISKLKTSLEYKQAVSEYINTVEESLLPKGNFIFEGYIVYPKEQVYKLFHEDYKNWPVAYRLEQIKKHLSNRLSIFKERIESSLEIDCDAKVEQIKESMLDTDERRNKVRRVIEEKEEKLKNINKSFNKAVGEYLPKISKKPSEYYKEFISNEKSFISSFAQQGNNEVLDNCQKYTKMVMESGCVELEDLAPIMHIKSRIHGCDKVKKLKHVVIDEAQDIGLYQFSMLKDILKESSFTVLGDISQGIHEHRGTNDWNILKNKVFGDDKCDIINLQQSYRSSAEIINAANSVIENSKDTNIVLASPIGRFGGKVEILNKNSVGEISKDIASKLKNLESKYNTIAIVCKTMNECKEMHSQLSKYEKGIQVINGKEKEYKGGVVIVPSYLSKGLEFDSVIIADASKEKYKENELDIKLLYVAMTRALHKLYIYSNGEESNLLKNI